MTLRLEHGHPAGWLVRSSGIVIGHCGIPASVDGAGCIEVGDGLAESYRHHGVGTEIVRAISDWLLTRPGVATLTSCIEPLDTASWRVREKVGHLRAETEHG